MVSGVFSVSRYIPRDKKIGVLVSGGWDSAVLWCMAKRICIARGQECVPFTVPKIDGAEHYANLELETVNSWLRIPPVKTTIVGKIDSENPSDYVTSGAWEILETGKAEYLLNAKNAYPPNMQEMLPDFPLPNDRYETPEEHKQYVGHPFATWTKAQTIELAFQIGIANIIMPITHSCTEQNRGRCNNCWWCKEREWGFNQIKKIDTGEN